MGIDSAQYWYPYNEKTRVEDVLDDNTLPTARSSLILTDDDSAASNGTAVNIVPETFGVLGHLESTTANNADAVIDDDNDDEILVTDNDSPGGVALYFDEDAELGSRFLADLSNYAGDAVWFLTSGGNAFKVTHNASPGTPGVQVYFDDDATDPADRLLFVSPTNADGSEEASKEMGLGLAALARGAKDIS